MENRPSFWNEQTQDIDDYWYNRISAFAYPIIGGAMLAHQASLMLRGKPVAENGINPIFIAVAGYIIYKGIKCAINIARERKGELEDRLNLEDKKYEKNK